MIRVVEVLEATAAGTRKHLWEIVAALPPEEFRVAVICANRRDPSFARDIESFRARGCPVHVLRMTRGLHPLWDPLVLLQMRRLLKSNCCDILHLHSSKAGWLGRLAATGLDCRVIYTPHAFPFLQRVLLRGLYWLLERLVVPATDLLLAVSRAEAEVARSTLKFPPERVRVLANALDVSALEAEVGSVPELGSVSEVRRFSFISELRRQKDPFTFLEAARRLRGHPTIRCVMPDKGAYSGAVRRYLRRHGLEEMVRLVPVADSLAPVYRLTDIAVLPSLWEGLPYSLLEALALRRPVIASNIRPLAEVLEAVEAGSLFPAGSSAALARRMESWAERPASELVQVAEKGRQLVLREYEILGWREAMRETYRSLAAVGSCADRRSRA